MIWKSKQVKIFKTHDFAYHKISVVFWQTDEHDEPAIVTEPYERAFTAANLKNEHVHSSSDKFFDEFEQQLRMRLGMDSGY